MSSLYQRFDTEAAYRASIDSVLAAARRNIRILDQDLSRMQLDSPERSRLLAEFLRKSPEQRLLVALHDCTLLPTRMPRLMELLTRYPQVLEIRSIPDEFRHLADCHILVDETHGVRRFHSAQPRGAMILDDAAEIHPWWQRFDELWSLCGQTGLGSRLPT